ncbi:hypothetical protein CHS0354_034251 [Potamilus streckersoni]|uniref:RING-type domain-containing protein n=1 Tax=Potamilus streckersoni TaxID=2493646 RepID=A0AAE0VQ54_9BIVA|nr:hypothetical protein CHS0354_034251 [Potamilus streckersoni]
MYLRELLPGVNVGNSTLDKACLPRINRTHCAGHTLPVYVDDAFIEKTHNGYKEILAFVVCDEASYYEKPLVSNYDRTSMACENEICITPKEKTRYPQFSQLSTRLATFVHSKSLTNQETLSNLGFFYKGQEDRVCCYECGVTLSRWSKDDDPLLEHIRYSPDCRYLATIVASVDLRDYKEQLQQIRVNSSGQGSTRARQEATSSQGDRKKIRSPEYSSYSVRLSTFARFPAIPGLDVNLIAAAGFYYTGNDDIVRCYACDGGLKRWEQEDDPWEEHCKWFPQCPHLIQSNYKISRNETNFAEKPIASARGDSYSEVLAGRVNDLTFGEQQTKEEAKPDLNTPAALALLDFGYSRKAVTMAIEELRRKGQATFTADDVLQVLISIEDSGIRLPTDDDNDDKEKDNTDNILSALQKVSSKNFSSEERLNGMKRNQSVRSETRDQEVCHLLKDNEKLIKQMMCKRCRKRQRNILLLPCTHFCLCEQCSKEVSLCPECWKPINERVKTYVS